MPDGLVKRPRRIVFDVRPAIAYTGLCLTTVVAVGVSADRRPAEICDMTLRGTDVFQ